MMNRLFSTYITPKKQPAGWVVWLPHLIVCMLLLAALPVRAAPPRSVLVLSIAEAGKQQDSLRTHVVSWPSAPGRGLSTWRGYPPVPGPATSPPAWALWQSSTGWTWYSPRALSAAATMSESSTCGSTMHRLATVGCRMFAVVTDRGTVQAVTSLAMAPKPRLNFLSAEQVRSAAACGL